MSDQPKPTTGEWTAAYIVKFLGLHSKYIESASFLADAHNAAIAAERRAAEVKWNEAVAVRDINHLNRIDELEKQLTAEREKFARGDFNELGDKIKELRAALAKVGK